MEKPRVIEVTDESELAALLAGGIGVPFVTQDPKSGKWYADAQELRQYRDGRNDSSSEVATDD